MLMAQRKHNDVAIQAPIAMLLFFIAYQALLQSFENSVLEALPHVLLMIVSITSLRFLKNREDVPVGLLLSLLFLLELLLLSLSSPFLTWHNATLTLLAAVAIFIYIRHEQKGRTF